MVEVELRDDVLLIGINNAPTNALSVTVRRELLKAIERANDAAVGAVVLHSADCEHFATSDRRNLLQTAAAPDLAAVADAFERCTKPVVAAMAGAATGGGFELALSCHYRICTSRASFAFADSAIGLVPSAGGIFRLTRLLDAPTAARLVAGGKAVGPQEALDLTLLDRVVDADLLGEAIAFAQTIRSDDLEARRLSQRPPIEDIAIRPGLDDLARELPRSSRGAELPLIVLELVRGALAGSFANSMDAVRMTSAHLRSSAQTAALVHIDSAEQKARILPADVRGAASRSIDMVGVIGAGTMGSAIAMNLADAGLRVRLVEVSSQALQAGLARIESAYEAMVKRGRITADQATARIGLIGGDPDMAAVGDCDLVIEAALEDMAVKREIFANLDRVAKSGAILATNTSYLDINAIAAETSRPSDIVGLHYFSPANVMNLMEVVRGDRTAPDVLVTAFDFARRTGKIPVLAGVCNGFIGNRMLRAYNQEAGLLLLEGATPAAIDGALTAFGMAMGPFAVADLSGIDIGYRARQAMPAGSFDPRAFALHAALVQSGQLGRKTGKGFYLYHPDAKSPEPNPAVSDLLASARATFAVEQREVSDTDIVERCMRSLAREGAAILSEGIAARSGDLDVVYVHGYGFPRHRGGPMFHAAHHDLR